MSIQSTAVMPELNQISEITPQLFREQMSNSTLGDFKNKLLKLLEAIDKEDEQTPVRLLIEKKYRYNAISCWTGEAFIRFTIDTERRF